MARDDVQATSWYRKAAEQGYADAQSALAYRTMQGLGVTKDVGKAIFWYDKAVAQNFPEAQYDLGYLYRHGTEVPQDNAKAVAWFRKSAAQNDASALADLGIMYATGDGLPHRVVPAYAFLKRSMTTEYTTPENAQPALKNLVKTMTDEQKIAGDKLLEQMQADGVLVALDKYQS